MLPTSHISTIVRRVLSTVDPGLDSFTQKTKITNSGESKMEYKGKNRTVGFLLKTMVCPLLHLILEVKIAQSCLTLCDLMDYIVPGILQARIMEWVAFPFCRGSFQPRDQTQGSPSLQADSLSAEPQGKPRNTGVGNLSLLQGIFLTQAWNQGLLHCRWILYQLSY